jgi:integrase
MSRPINRLSARKVETLKTPGWHADGAGLYLRIQKGGSRSWVLVDTRGGKRKERGLGSAATISLKEARELRDNPPEEVPAEIPLFGLPRTDDNKLGGFAAEFISGVEEGFKNEVHRAQWRSTIDQHAASLHAMRIDAITTNDVVAVLRPIWLSIPETASRLRGRIERILDAAAAKGFRDPDKRNPATWKGHLEHFLPKRQKKSLRAHHDAIPWQEMPAFWALLASRQSSTTVMALRFTILTAARTGEVIAARRREFDLDAKTWTVPGERMKMGIEHTVTLSDAAVAIVRELWPDSPDDFIFDGAKRGAHLSNMAMLRLLQVIMGRKETVHGFRSSFRDWAGDATDYPRELAEMALAHAVGDAVEQAYRRGRAIEKRRPLLDDWAQYLGA